MNPIFSKKFFSHHIILASIGVVGVIALGSGAYYYFATREPQNSLTSLTASTTATTIIATGKVEPAQNPDLAFIAGGRVTVLNTTVGQRVTQGQLLASLDTASLGAQRAQAAASLAAAQAKLDEMKSGPRQVDVQIKQTAVSQAETSLANTYANAPANIAQAYDKSFSGVSGYTDNLFNQPNTANPTFAFMTTNGQLAIDGASDRIQVQNELTAWNTEVGTLLKTSSPGSIDAALVSALAHLNIVRTYSNGLLVALTHAVPTTNFPASSVAAAQTAVTMLRDTVDGLILTLQGEQQQITSGELAVQSAQDALNQTLAGASTQEIAAQEAQVAAGVANTQNFDAQIANAVIRAPFSGTVSSVRIKLGQIVPPNMPAISMNPDGMLQITAYVSEADASKINAGDQADVTLDAYGSGKHFAAAIASVDRSPTLQSSVPAYRVILQFTQNDPAISSGMTANITIKK